MNNKSLAKRLIKDLVLPKASDTDENCADKKPKTEPVSDGYVIVSFCNRKKAQIQTATFSDVSKHTHDTINILKSQNGPEETNIPDENNFYGEAFWIGSEDEDDNDSKTPAISGNGESDRSSQKDDTDSISSQPRPKMTRLTALSKGLLNTEPNPIQLKTKGSNNSNFLGDSRAVYYGGTEDGRKMLRCRECGKHYRNDYSLRHHICLRRKEVWKKGDVPKELVDGQLIYFCPTCSKPFRWMGNLTRHFYVHTGQRFFKCDVCEKEFFSAYQVRRHMNSHTGMRYKCRVCEKPFTCVYACTWHMRQHTIEHSQNAHVNTSSTSTTTTGIPTTTTIGNIPSLSTTVISQQQHHSDENQHHHSISNSSSEGISPNDMDIIISNNCLNTITNNTMTIADCKKIETKIELNSDVPIKPMTLSSSISNMPNSAVPSKVVNSIPILTNKIQTAQININQVSDNV